MEVFVRSKRVTDPLNDIVKACLCGKDLSISSASGSEHESGSSFYSSTSSSSSTTGEECCLSYLVHSFLEGNNNDDSVQLQEDDSSSSSSSDSSLEDDPLPHPPHHRGFHRFSESEVKESIKNLLNHSKNSNATRLLSHHVSIATEMFRFFKQEKSIYMRKIMVFLRELGYNAGICKTKWESNGNLTAGCYEFIDVVVSEDDEDDKKCQQRYFIDVEFYVEFEIARPTTEYASLLKVLPIIFLGRSEELKQIVRLISDAAKTSLMSRDLHLPPWRKNRYMQSKWFGPYRRTVNSIPSSTKLSGFEKFSVKCRSVGFDDTVTDRPLRFVFPAATRTKC
ncbi:hypothetical protein AQUCO_01200205v1 [Aquilegia coerulea]|uniref:DUF506 domain-containing protein n=1 Tax=Aquilegia coerulea TaxID=218851 RepID=A0A2G5E4W0_AQUCA|nr:hypothetical protein AQUCO_01200205v1 [Aquilegia coerulea]